MSWRIVHQFQRTEIEIAVSIVGKEKEKKEAYKPNKKGNGYLGRRIIRLLKVDILRLLLIKNSWNI